MKITLEIGTDNVVHSTMHCDGESLARTRECIQLAIHELQKGQEETPTEEEGKTFPGIWSLFEKLFTDNTGPK